MSNKICVTIGTPSLARLRKDLKIALGKADYVEVRLDFLRPSQVPLCLNFIKKYMKRCICTLRPKSEGGKFAGTESERISILKLIAEFNPHLLDVEYNTLKRNDRLVQYLNKTGVSLLVSWHDFANTPQETTLRSMVKKMSRFSKNIKIVTTAKQIGDTLRVLGLYKKVSSRINLIAFAMGDYGRMSRILCTNLGSPYTYASLGKSIAPGQFSLNEIKSIFKLQKR